MHHAPCRRRSLASGDFALVEHCDCGAVHITVGAVTLRLAASALAPLADTLQDAAATLVQERLRAKLVQTEALSGN